MKKLFVMVMAIAVSLLTGCGVTRTTKVSHFGYDDDGNKVVITQVTKRDSDDNIIDEYTIIREGNVID